MSAVCEPMLCCEGSPRPKVYPASKLHHAKLWQELRGSWPDVEFTARWPGLHLSGTGQRPELARVFWEVDFADIVQADFVMVFSGEGDDLRGALVEAGIGLGLGKQVIVVGENPQYGTWQYHPGVSRCDCLADARELMLLWKETR